MYVLRVQLERLALGVVSVAAALKIAMLFKYPIFSAEFNASPAMSSLMLLISCLSEHFVFTMTLVYWLSSSFAHLRLKDHMDNNIRMYHAVAFPEIGKVFVAFLQVWDAEPTMPFIYAALMLSLQYSSLRCVAANKSVSVFKPFCIALLLRTMCRLCFHSLHYTLVLGIII